jgi:DNA-binding GntR family transcriptional regulator
VEDLHTRVVEDLGQQVVSGSLPVGTTFRIRDLAADRGVSVSVVREAVRVLEGLGLVSSRRRVGVRVEGSRGWCVLDSRVARWHQNRRDGSLVADSLVRLALGVASDAAGRVAAQATRAERQELVSSTLGLGAGPELIARLLAATGDPVYLRLAELIRLAPPTALPDVVGRSDAVALAVALHDGDALASHAAMDVIVDTWARAAACSGAGHAEDCEPLALGVSAASVHP